MTRPRSGDAELPPVLPWRIVAGVLLHFAALAYVLIVPLLCLLLAPAHATPETLARLALRLSLWFLAGLAGVTLAAVPAAMLLDRVVGGRRRADRARSPAAVQSHLRVEDAARTPLDEASATLLARIAAAPWDHEDPRHQALARDLDEVVRATAAALASAPPDRRTAVAATGAQALGRLFDELELLAADRARADEARVTMLSKYVQTRYPALDSPFEPD